MTKIRLILSASLLGNVALASLLAVSLGRAPSISQSPQVENPRLKAQPVIGETHTPVVTAQQPAVAIPPRPEATYVTSSSLPTLSAPIQQVSVPGTTSREIAPASSSPSLAPAPASHVYGSQVISESSPVTVATPTGVGYAPNLSIPLGNSIAVQGQRVAVDTYVPATENTPASAAVVVTEDPAKGGTSQAAPESDPNKSGLSYEDELFRTRWGWQAYDLARKAAIQSQTAR